MWFVSTAIAAFLAAGQVPEGPVTPGALVVTASAAQPGRALTEALRGDLITRAMDSWEVPTYLEPTPATPPNTFEVALRWSESGVWVRIQESEEVLVERKLSIEDPQTTKLMLWLLVRSTIERALIQPTVPGEPVDETPPIPEVPETEPVDTSTRSKDKEISETTTATVAEEAEPVGRTPPAPVRIERVSRGARFVNTLGGIFTNPLSLNEGQSFSMSLMVNGIVDTGASLGGGASFQALARLSPMFAVGAEIGYRHEGRNEELSMHHIPLTLLGTGKFFDSLDLDLGVAAMLDIKLVASEADVDVLAGVYVGPYGRYRMPVLQERDGRALALTADVGLLFAINRGQYRLSGGETTTDGLMQIRLAVGVEWTWP